MNWHHLDEERLAMLVRLLSREIHEVLSRERRRIRERCSINQYHQYLLDLSLPPYLVCIINVRNDSP